MNRGKTASLTVSMFAVAVWLCLGPQAVEAEVLELFAVRDASLFSNGNSNGAGPALFCGRTGTTPGPNGIQHRALVVFDVARCIPAGSVVNSVTLEMTMTAASLFGSNETHTLHRVLSDWGEGESDGPGGVGATPLDGDCTWQHTFYPDQFWAHAGGDYEATVSGSALVGDFGDVPTTYTWGSTPQMVADVQAWLDNPESDFGWIMIGDEANFNTAKTFGGRVYIPGQVPKLIVDFDAPPNPCPADCGEIDGVVDVVDLLGLLAQWGGCGSCDLNDGGVDVTDLLAVLAAWGDCPE